MQIKIESLKEREFTRKSGEESVGLIIDTFSQRENRIVSLFGFPISRITETWEYGDVVDVDIEQRSDKWYWKPNANTKPSPDKRLEILKRIETKLDILLGKKDAQEVAKQFNGQVVSDLGNPVNPTEIRVEDIPF